MYPSFCTKGEHINWCINTGHIISHLKSKRLGQEVNLKSEIWEGCNSFHFMSTCACFFLVRPCLCRPAVINRWSAKAIDSRPETGIKTWESPELAMSPCSSMFNPYNMENQPPKSRWFSSQKRAKVRWVPESCTKPIGLLISSNKWFIKSRKECHRWQQVVDRIGCLGLGRSWFAAHAKKKEAPIDVQIHLTCLLFRSVVRSGTGPGMRLLPMR